ncbi:MAG: hypothetical protein HBSAPP03_22180 [Phycisphaerae bacterium]|nr:MAG: hypothetical protein HBSAPP03_22180 [Phycisphaerae bacterium]
MNRAASIVAMVLFALHAGSQTLPENAGEPESLVQTHQAALGALSPENPEAYFLLGEEIADGRLTTERRVLAGTLFVLTMELDRIRPRGGRLAASACIALADLTRSDTDRRWLGALAEAFDPAHAAVEWAQPAPPETDDAEGYQVATTLGLVRSGDGVRARQQLARPGGRAALLRYDALLSRLGAGTASAVLREAERWPCPECGNQRLSKRARPDTPDGRVCFHCLGNPGPKLSADELLAQLRVESWLLRGSQRSWAAQIVLDDGAPLQDPDPSGVAKVFGVDPKAFYWRNGRWCRTPDCSNPEEPATPPAKPDPNPPKTPIPAGVSGS